MTLRFFCLILTSALKMSAQKVKTHLHICPSWIHPSCIACACTWLHEAYSVLCAIGCVLHHNLTANKHALTCLRFMTWTVIKEPHSRHTIVHCSYLVLTVSHTDILTCVRWAWFCCQIILLAFLQGLLMYLLKHDANSSLTVAHPLCLPFMIRSAQVMFKLPKVDKGVPEEVHDRNDIYSSSRCSMKR